mgnify:CR=1 FL=1
MEKSEQAKKNFEEGIKFFQTKDFKQAQIYFEKTLEDAPNSSPTLENLSKSYLETRDYNKAEKILKYFISLEKEDDQIAYELLYDIYSSLNKYWELKELTKKAIERKKFDKSKILQAKLFYPNFFSSEEEVKKIREDFTMKIEKLAKEFNLESLDLSSNLLKPINFELSYDGYDNLKINKNLNEIYKKIYPELQSFGTSTNYSNKKIKIGFISQFFSNHTIMMFFKGLIYKINKDIFDVYVFHSNFTLPSAEFTEINESAVLYGHQNIILSSNFKEKVIEIKSKNLDILFYPDIHMSTNLYYLTMLRLAKCQITSWGHPETTGNNNIDYFLSSKLLETKECEKKYSENLILSEYLPMYFYEPKVTKKISLEELNNKNLYSCTQSLFKIHPSFDLVIKKILQKDRKAKIIFFKDRKDILSKMYYERLKKIIPENIDRIEFLERLKPEEFINHCGKTSVLLDTFWFGSGNTFMKSMYYGTPTVTKPTSYLRGRIVAGAYKQMKIDEAPVVNNIDDYIDKCVELANKNILDLKMYYKEQAYKHLFENYKAVKDLENIFKSLVD